MVREEGLKCYCAVQRCFKGISWLAPDTDLFVLFFLVRNVHIFQLLLSVSRKLLFIRCSLLSSVCVCVGSIIGSVKSGVEGKVWSNYSSRPLKFHVMVIFIVGSVDVYICTFN